jgi:hypothetical protein
MRHPTLSEARSVARGEEFTDDHLFGGGKMTVVIVPTGTSRTNPTWLHIPVRAYDRADAIARVQDALTTLANR